MGKRYHRQYIGSGIKIGATGNVQYAYDLGRMANEAAASMGNNVAFAPVCDIHPISSSLCISEIYLALVYCEVVFSCHFKSWIEVCKSCSSKNCFN